MVILMVILMVYTEVGWGNSLQTILKYLSKMVYLQYFLSFHANTCLYLLRQSAWAGSLHANIVQRVNMTHLLRNHPWFFHQSSCVECWFARQLSSSSIYWFFSIDVRGWQQIKSLNSTQAHFINLTVLLTRWQWYFSHLRFCFGPKS